MDLNKDINMREMIIFNEPYNQDNYPGGIRSFEDMTPETLQKLVNMKFADEDEAQNEDAPCIAEILAYARTHKNVKLSGYAVDTTRNDYRVTIEAIDQYFETRQDRIDFMGMFECADEINTCENSGSAWYD